MRNSLASLAKKAKCVLLSLIIIIKLNLQMPVASLSHCSVYSFLNIGYIRGIFISVIRPLSQLNIGFYRQLIFSVLRGCGRSLIITKLNN